MLREGLLGSFETGRLFMARNSNKLPGSQFPKQNRDLWSLKSLAELLIVILRSKCFDSWHVFGSFELTRKHIIFWRGSWWSTHLTDLSDWFSFFDKRKKGCFSMLGILCEHLILKDQYHYTVYDIKLWQRLCGSGALWIVPRREGGRKSYSA